MSNYCIMRIQKIKSFEHLQNIYKHNYRISDVPNANPSLQDQNRDAIDLGNKTYVDAFQDFTTQLGYGPCGKPYRKNGVLALEIILSMSPEATKNVNIEAWEKNNLDFVSKAFCVPEGNGSNILSAVTHFDEHTIHQHILVVPLVGDKICANHFIDGRKKLSDLQTAYAEKMKIHGLVRGISGSSSRYEDIHRYYSSLNRALDISIPEWTKDDTPITYQEKVKEDIKDRAAVYFRKEKEHESELRKLKDIHANEKKNLERQLSNAKRNIYRYKQKQEELERELGPINVVKKTVEVIRLLRAGLDAMDTTSANNFMEQMNLIIVNQRHKEREKAEAEKKRKKNVFEKIQ